MSTDTESPRVREFAIDDILSVTTGRLVSRRHIDGVYDLLGFMTSEPGLMTHQLPRASRECEDNLRAQHPDLDSIVLPEWNFDGMSREDAMAVVTAWAEYVAREYGETRPVRALPAADHTHIDPVAELKMMRPDAPILAVTENGIEEL